MSIDRRIAIRAGARSLVLALAPYGPGLAAAGAGAVDPDTAQFGGRCAMGLAEGREVATDCSITWTADDGKAFCFHSDEARDRFVGNSAYLRVKASEFVSLSETQRVGERMKRIRKRDVKYFLNDTITARSQANDGYFPVYDPLTKQKLDLVFEELQFMRTLHGYGFFPDVVFHAKEDPEKRYWVDFWIRPRDSGKLEIFETRIYKGPRRNSDGWQLVTRQPPPWWWIPASEHPGEMEEKRGWELMSAIESHVLEASIANGGLYRLEHPETGEPLDLEYIGIHQPVRRLADDGRFFACTDFRLAGSDSQYFDVDFWLNDVDGTIAIGEVRVHKIPQQVDGNWVQVPKYDFDDLEFEVVP